MSLSSFTFSFDGKKSMMQNLCWIIAEPILGTCSHLMSWNIWNERYSRPHTVYTQNIKEMICVYLNYKGNDCPDIHKC